MILDVIFAVLMILAIIKGYRRGLIVGVFSLIAIIIGLAAAIKLSTVAADHLGRAMRISDRWLPIISFAVVFLVVVLLVRLGANLIQKMVETVMLGWVNRLGGIILYIAIYTTIFSIILFYFEQMQIIKPVTTENSVTYPFVQPWGPKAINSLGSVIPLFRDMFDDLKEFFGGISKKISLANLSF